jgi:hypothetical protein
MTSLPAQIIALHLALEDASLPHAFGGALALAWCTERPRGTSDIDLNVFVDAERFEVVLGALPNEVEPTEGQRDLLRRDGQARLFWDRTPIDLFLNTAEFHGEAMVRARWHRFGGHAVPFLDCSDLAVFKAFFDRTKDWADIEEMVAAGTLDRTRTLGVLVEHLGGSDPRIERLRQLRPPGAG